MSGSWSNVETNLIVLVEQVSGYSGIFGYSPAPGAGALVFSVSAVAGTDPYGNDYLAGLGVYDNTNHLFADYTSAQTLYGVTTAGVPDTADAGSIVATNGNAPVNFTSIRVTSPKNAALPNQLVADFFGGTTVAGSGPTFQLQDSAGLVDVILKLTGHQRIDGQEPGSILLRANGASGQTADLMQLLDNGGWRFGVTAAGETKTFGPLVAADSSGNPATWQTPSYAANWANSTAWGSFGGGGQLQFRHTGLDRTWIQGVAKASTGAGATIFTLPSGYYNPNQTTWGSAVRASGSTTSVVAVAVANTGAVITSVTPANGDEFLLNFEIPLGNIA